MMTSEIVLVLALVALALVILAALLLRWRALSERRRRPAADQTTGGGPVSLEELELSVPFSERVLRPLLEKIGLLARPAPEAKEETPPEPASAAEAAEAPSPRPRWEGGREDRTVAEPPPPGAPPAPSERPADEVTFHAEVEITGYAGRDLAAPAPEAEAAARTEAPRLAEAEPAAAAAVEPVRFSAHYPRRVQPDDWQPLHAYIFKEAAAAAVAQDARAQLGKKAADYAESIRPASQPVAAGALVTATPRLDGFQFNPPSASVYFLEDWHRFDFKLRATDAPINASHMGYVTFAVEGVIAADVPLVITVSQAVAGAETAAESVNPYQAIFCSYSHQDTRIVERVEAACKALGLTYLRDAATLRSGQIWNEELMRLIEGADIFQLFWSTNAAASKYVEQEWRHALGLGRQGQVFIRPVYWTQPMPPPPSELGHIHFAYQPELAE